MSTYASAKWGKRTAAWNVSSPPPIVTLCILYSGINTGGTSVTLTGTGFQTGATVTFGGNSATSVNVVGATSITCVTPAHAHGWVDIIVTNPDGQAGTLVDGFGYYDTITTYQTSNSSMKSGSLLTVNKASGSPYPGPPYFSQAVSWNINATVNIGKNASSTVCNRRRELWAPQAGGSGLLIPSGIIQGDFWTESNTHMTSEDFVSLDCHYVTGDPTLVATYEDLATPLGSIASGSLPVSGGGASWTQILLDIGVLKANIGNVLQVLTGTHTEEAGSGAGNLLNCYDAQQISSYIKIYT